MTGPPTPAAGTHDPHGGTPPPAPLDAPQDRRGDHAGFASRFIAFVVDCVLSIAVFELVLAASSFAATVLTGTSIPWHRGDTWVALAFFVWQFVYYAYSWTTSGKTPGMMILGVQVVGQDGSMWEPGAGSCERWRFRDLPPAGAGLPWHLARA